MHSELSAMYLVTVGASGAWRGAGAASLTPRAVGGGVVVAGRHMKSTGASRCFTILALRSGTRFGAEVPSSFCAGKLLCIPKKEKLIAKTYTSGKSARTSCPATPLAASGGRRLHTAAASRSSCAQSVKQACAANVAAPKPIDAKIGPGVRWLSTLLDLTSSTVVPSVSPVSSALSTGHVSRAASDSRGRLQRAESPSRQPGIELMLPGSSVIASGKERDEQQGPPGVFGCGSDATRMVCMPAEECTPKMRKRSGDRRVGILTARGSASGIAINPTAKSGAPYPKLRTGLNETGLQGGNRGKWLGSRIQISYE